MTIADPCVTCILNQVEKTLAVMEIDPETAEKIRTEAFAMSRHFSFDHTPPFVAKDIYQMISRFSGNDDPLENVKKESMRNAAEHLPFIREQIAASDDPLFAALKAAVAGNVIDFGAKEQFDLAEEIGSVFRTDFAINDYEKLREDIEANDTLMILADNSGENVYDKVLMETIKTLYPGKRIRYVVRGRPIINDITLKEAEQIGIGAVAEIIDSGVDTPGLDLLRATKAFVEEFKRAPLVLAKGMGNYECLEDSRQSIFFLFKVKCDVVAASIGADVGSLILRQR
jgi:uncharacterized protein with ATP-grasp and redox domains